MKKTSPSLMMARLPSILALAALGVCNTSWALDYGPFSLTGFAKAEVTRGSNRCNDCQRYPDENKQRNWADETVPGKSFGTSNNHLLLIHPYLGAKFDLGSGYKLSGLASQRWRNGYEDIPGYMYDKNIALSHEDYGSVRYGAMTTRSWSVADYPYGTNVGMADAWGASGAGYGLLTKAIRYTSPMIDLFNGDLVLEMTYDRGNTNFTVNKPKFMELYAQYHKGDLVIDSMYQDTRNGTPSAWGHGPFTGLTPFAKDDAKLGSSGQSIAMAMARYQIDSHFEVSGGLRHNRWSGAYAVITEAGTSAQWNEMFNVNWGGSLNGVANPGYAATSKDFMLGLRYKTGAWIAHTGMTYLGKAKTDNPSERGQSNSALINTVGLSYNYGHGLSLYGLAGRVRYDHLGLSPMSMPGNSSFTNVDSRLSTTGNWAGLGAVFVF